MGVVLGIDVSTTATKAVLLDAARRRARRSASSAYGFEQPHPLWSEQDPRLWWDGAVDGDPRRRWPTAGVGRGRRRGRSASPARCTASSLLDAAGEVLRPAILWNDQRTAAECDEIRAAVGPERLVAITGNDALTGFTAPKLAWVRDHEPDVWARVAHVLLPKDYVRYRLTGEYALDKADGAGTHPVRPRGPRLVAGDARRARHRPGVDAADVRGPGGDGRGVGRGRGGDRAARRARRSMAGGGDQAANAVGVGAVVPGPRGAVAGDVGRGVRDHGRARCSSRRAASTRSATPCPGRWHMMSVMLSAAGSLRWFRDAIAPGVEFGDLVDEAAEVPAGSDGLLFLPYLSGERSPHPDPLARGAFVGLTLAHDRRHLTRAVLEGVAFGLRDGLDLMTERRDAGARADPGVGRRHGQRAVAPDPRGRPARRRSRPSARPRAPRTARGCWRPWARAGSRRSRRRPTPWWSRRRPRRPGPDARALRGAARPLPRALPGARALVPAAVARRPGHAGAGDAVSRAARPGRAR